MNILPKADIIRRSALILAVAMLSLSWTEAYGQKVYPVFYEAQKESYVKSMKVVFGDIRSQKWDKAIKDFAKVEEKSSAAQAKSPEYSNTQLQALHPLPSVAMAMMLSSDIPGTEAAAAPFAKDYPKAYYHLKQALAFKEQTRLKDFLTSPDVNVNITILQDRIESQLCKAVTEQNTEKAYDDIIDTLLPTSLKMQDMRFKREELAYNTILRAPTPTECIRYLDKYKDALPLHRQMIADALDSIRYKEVDGTVEGFRKYIDTYPESKYVTRAKDTMMILEYRALNENTSAHRAFVEKYPSSRYTIEVMKKLKELAYREALDECNAEAYLKFCEDFPYEVRYATILDSLLRRTTNEIYDTIFAGGKPDNTKYLTETLVESERNRDAAEQQMREKSLVPPARMELWTGIRVGANMPYKYKDIVGINIMSKKTATVHLLLSEEPIKQEQQDTSPADKSSTDKSSADNTSKQQTTPKIQQRAIDILFIFEGKELKVSEVKQN